jgi:hypothetical protein
MDDHDFVKAEADGGVTLRQKEIGEALVQLGLNSLAI